MKMQWVIIWGYFYLKIDCATFERTFFSCSLFVIEGHLMVSSTVIVSYFLNCWQTALSALSLIKLPFFVKLEFSEAFYVPLSK